MLQMLGGGIGFIHSILGGIRASGAGNKEVFTMNRKKLLASALAATMLAASFAPAFAASPAKYDGKSYESLGYTSEDPDGEFNLAVISRKDAKIVGNAQYIRGSVYANGDIYVSNGSGNRIDGLFISGTESSFDSGEGTTDDYIAEGYIHVTNDLTRDGINAYSTKPEYAGAVYDEDTSFDLSYEGYTVPEIANNAGDVEANEWGSDQWGGNNGPKTVSVDTHYDSLYLMGDALTIDTTNGDVNVVIDKLIKGSAVQTIRVAGGHKANIYVKSMADTQGNARTQFEGIIASTDSNIYDWRAYSSTGTKDDTAADDNARGYLAQLGDPASASLYIDTPEGKVELYHSMIAANIFSNAADFSVEGASKTVGNITVASDTFEITGNGTLVEGTVYAPNAVSGVWGSGTLYGQLYTDELVNKGEGRIIYKADASVSKLEATPTPEATAEPTAAPTETPAETAAPEVTEAPTPAPTANVVLPKGPAKDYSGFKYAYIFGYEPYDSEDGTVILDMAPENRMTREELCAMLTRVDDQYNGKIGKSRTMAEGIFKDFVTPDRWSYNALAAVAASGAFLDYENLDPAVPVSRGEVARIVDFMVGLNEYDDSITFTDIAGNDNEVYIKIAATAGYINGRGDGTFDPDAAITRAEFCSILNKIIGRTTENGYVLETADGIPVTAELYGFRDLSASKWYYETVLFATSAFDGKYVDISTRQTNIRNILDGYDSQTDY
jgi:hypothetical protein